MNVVSQIAVIAAEAEHHGNVALETLIFGIIAAVIFTALAVVTLSYKNVANRHTHKAEAWAARNGHQTGAHH